MRPERVIEELRGLANTLEQLDEERKQDLQAGAESAVVVDFPDFPFDSLALWWCDGFGPVRPYRVGDPLISSSAESTTGGGS